MSSVEQYLILVLIVFAVFAIMLWTYSLGHEAGRRETNEDYYYIARRCETARDGEVVALMPTRDGGRYLVAHRSNPERLEDKP